MILDRSTARIPESSNDGCSCSSRSESLAKHNCTHRIITNLAAAECTAACTSAKNPKFTVQLYESSHDLFRSPADQHTVLVRAQTSAVRLQSAQRRLSKTRYGRTTVYGRTVLLASYRRMNSTVRAYRTGNHETSSYGLVHVRTRRRSGRMNICVCRTQSHTRRFAYSHIHTKGSTDQRRAPVATDV